jgi:predicted outer membrane repeat protein
MYSQTISKTILMLIASCLAALALGLVMMTGSRSALADASIVYVDADASPGGDGQAWGTAYNYLQDALDEANANGASDYEIWVAEGIYCPDEDGDGDHISGAMTETFRLNYNNVQLYGGFVATETIRSQRDWQANVTVLSGDIDGNDTTNADGVVTDADNVSGNNTNHVLFLDGVTNEPITGTTTIDGFTITAGQATSTSGGGLYCDGHEGNQLDPHICSPALTNIIFSGNLAEGSGGAMFNYAYHNGESSPTLTNVIFSGNSAKNGGAMYNDGHFAGESSPTLTNVIFKDNSAGGATGAAYSHGGAMCNGGYQGTSSPTLVNVVFSNNSAEDDGGAMYNSGTHGRANPTLTNVTFSGNSAGDDGGAMYNSSYPIPDNLNLSNVILWGNTAEDRGDQMYNSYMSLIIGYSDVQGGLLGSGMYYSNSTLTDLGGNIDSNPRFVGAAFGNLRLFDTSPCIDAGDNDAVPSGITTDLDGNPRFVEFPPPGGTGNGTPPLVDMGAYEEPLDGYHEYRVYLPLVLKE